MLSLQQTAMLGGAANAKVASYVLVAADAGDAITMSNASPTTITVNTGLFAEGDIVTIINLGAGACTITAGTATVDTSGSLVLATNQGGVLRFTSASAAIFFQFATPASGDIEGVTAGTGISGGGTSGTVTITNDMATTITTNGDLIYGTGSGTYTRRGIGSTGNVLTVAGGVPTWAAASSGALTKITSAAFSSVASVEIDNCFTSTYTKYFLIWEATAVSVQGIDLQLQFRYAGPTTQTSDYNGAAFSQSNANTKTDYGFSGANQATVWTDLRTGTQTSFGNAYFSQVGQSSQAPTYFGSGFGANSENIIFYNGYVGTARTYTGFLLKTSSSTMSGTYAVYGLAN